MRSPNGDLHVSWESVHLPDSVLNSQDVSLRRVAGRPLILGNVIRISHGATNRVLIIKATVGDKYEGLTDCK